MKIPALKYEKGYLKKRYCNVSEERLFHIFINKKHIVSLFALPKDLDELVTGFLVSEGVTGYEKIKGIERANCELWVETGENIPEIEMEIRSSGCSGISVIRNSLKPVESRQKFDKDIILNSLAHLEKSEEWKLTGGTHFAALISAEGEFLHGFEDVGRHNALDKIIGWALINNHSLQDKFVLFTGRLSTGMVMKASRVGIPLLVSNTAAFHQAIKTAEELNITLIGFARYPGFNVYSNFWRIANNGVRG